MARQHICMSGGERRLRTLYNDGWEDIFVVNGHLYPEADKFNMGLQYRQTPLVFLNNRDKTFRETALSLPNARNWKSRGMAVGDFDNNGRLDIRQ